MTQKLSPPGNPHRPGQPPSSLAISLPCPQLGSQFSETGQPLSPAAHTPPLALMLPPGKERRGVRWAPGRKLGVRWSDPGPWLARGSQRRQEKPRDAWHSPGSWVSCPQRQKHLVIWHLRKEDVLVTTPAGPPASTVHTLSRKLSCTFLWLLGQFCKSPWALRGLGWFWYPW